MKYLLGRVWEGMNGRSRIKNQVFDSVDDVFEVLRTYVHKDYCGNTDNVLWGFYVNLWRESSIHKGCYGKSYICDSNELSKVGVGELASSVIDIIRNELNYFTLGHYQVFRGADKVEAHYINLSQKRIVRQSSWCCSGNVILVPKSKVSINWGVVPEHKTNS